MGHVAAVIVAAGTGARMGIQAVSKQFIPVQDRPILAHTLARFERCGHIDEIVLVIREDEHARCTHLLAEAGITKVSRLVHGGAERQDSVWNGLQHVAPDTEIVLIHDAVRMFVTPDILERSIAAARECGAGVVAIPAHDTIKTAMPVGDDVFVDHTPDRRLMWQAQTPQSFQYAIICDLHRKAHSQGLSVTDDAMLAEHFGQRVKIVPGTFRNIKITTPDDLVIAEAFLSHETEERTKEEAERLRRRDVG